MTLRQKLFVTFALVLALVGIQTAVSVILLTQVVEGSALLVRPALNRVDLLAHMESDLLRLRTLEYSFLWDTSESLRWQFGMDMESLRVAIQQRMDKYRALQLDEARTEALDGIAQAYEDYLASQQRVVEAAQRGDRFPALWEYIGFQPSFQELDNQVHALRHQEYRATENLRDQMIQAPVWARWPLGLVVVLVGIAEMGLGWYVSRGIALSLEGLQQGARRIAQENFEEPVAMPPERELANLAETLNAVMVTLAANKAERARLEEERLRLLQERINQVVRAQEEERARVSRELHDQAGQVLTALHYGLSRVQRLSQDPAIAAELRQLDALAAETGRQIGALARDLRPAALDDLGLIPALRSYVREFSERIGLTIEFSLSGSIPRLSPEAETTVFRVVQEALTNVAKHASAQHAWVEVARQHGQIQVQVRDDGRGFDPGALAQQSIHQKGLRPGLGLAGIHERVQLLGGRLELDAAPGKGTQLLVTFPVQVEATAPTVLV